MHVPRRAPKNFTGTQRNFEAARQADQQYEAAEAAADSAKFNCETMIDCAPRAVPHFVSIAPALRRITRVTRQRVHDS